MSSGSSFQSRRAATLSGLSDFYLCMKTPRLCSWSLGLPAGTTLQLIHANQLLLGLENSQDRSFQTKTTYHKWQDQDCKIPVSSYLETKTTVSRTTSLAELTGIQMDSVVLCWEDSLMSDDVEAACDTKRLRLPIIVAERLARSWSRCTGSQPAGDYK